MPKKAMVVDSDFFFVEFLSGLLEKRGYTVRKAYDGKQGIAGLDEGPFDHSVRRSGDAQGQRSAFFRIRATENLMVSGLRSWRFPGRSSNRWMTSKRSVRIISSPRGLSKSLKSI